MSSIADQLVAQLKEHFDSLPEVAFTETSVRISHSDAKNLIDSIREITESLGILSAIWHQNRIISPASRETLEQLLEKCANAIFLSPEAAKLQQLLDQLSS